MKPVIKFKKLPHFSGHVPQYQTPGAAGCDVHASLDSPIKIQCLQRALIPTGLIVEIPQGFEIQVRPRSGLAFKNGMTVLNAPGTIDSDYRGELKIIVVNHGQEEFVVNNGDRIAQLVISPVIQASFEEIQELTTTSRGQGGFGSTGIKTVD